MHINIPYISGTYGLVLGAPSAGVMGLGEVEGQARPRVCQVSWGSCSVSRVHTLVCFLLVYLMNLLDVFVC